MPPGYQPTGGGSPLQGGVPWESEHGSMLGRWWETMTAVNFRGRPFFTSAAQSDDAVSACMFSMTTGAIGGAIMGMFYMIFFAIWGTAMFAAFGSHKAGAAMAGMGIGMGILAWLLMVVGGCIAGFIGPWIGGGIHHLVLAMVGGVGQDKDYAHSVRVNAFAQSAAYLWAPIPGVGGLVSLGFSAKNHIEGYDITHGCGGGKAFLAWFSPVICCCCSYFMLFMFAAMLG
ncbi:MAG: hypothetical protein DRI90_13420 [Deltaproteobacteria bacterium]|nr:MAG: hypothetical protein DRI90_13420 [Deltaproteobacteria bacterium]